MGSAVSVRPSTPLPLGRTAASAAASPTSEVVNKPPPNTDFGVDALHAKRQWRHPSRLLVNSLVDTFAFWLLLRMYDISAAAFSTAYDRQRQAGLKSAASFNNPFFVHYIHIEVA